jgi:hypothetical protein
MHARLKTFLGCEAIEKLCKFNGLFLAETGAEVGLMLTGDLGDFCRGFVTLRSKLERVDAAIIFGGVAFEETTLLEFIQDGYEAAGEHAQVFGKLLLRKTRRSSNHAQNTRMMGHESKRKQPLRKARRSVRSDLGKQKRGELAARRLRTVLGHILIISYELFI